ncbi:MAG: hypothetical protein QOI21_3029 [Actinomycetota bacterium]|uniref:hypothetical protein n=1 Tax=Streptomyces sp. NPDC058371 TaxID=3346463 RepID=UPI0028C5F33E|nr:hypothetical protein [Actinomycetota bacterium]
MITEAALHGLANLDADRSGIPEAICCGRFVLPGDAGTAEGAARSRDPGLGKAVREQATASPVRAAQDFGAWGHPVMAARVMPSSANPYLSHADSQSGMSQAR